MSNALLSILMVVGVLSASGADGTPARFRVEKTDGAWWLVDPDGKPYRDLDAGDDAGTEAAEPGAAPFVCEVKTAAWRIGPSSHALPDPYDTNLLSAVTAALSARTDLTDRQCIGVLVEAALDFGRRHEDLALQVLAAPDDQPAKVEFLKRLKAKDIVDEIPRDELCAFTDSLIWDYFYLVRRVVKRLDPRLLYLGCRFAAPPPEWVERNALLHIEAVCGDGLGEWRPKEMDTPVVDPDSLCRPTPERAKALKRDAFADLRDETDDWQGRIDAAWKRGGGTVEVTPGCHRVHGLRLRSNVVLHLQSGAVIESVRDGLRFPLWNDDRLEPIPPPPPGSADRYLSPDFRALIRLHAAKNAAIIGDPGSLIDGCNSFSGDPESEEGYRGVHGILAFAATNCVFRGYRMYRSGNWSHHLRACEGLRIENVTIEAGHDGIHLLRCRDIEIRNCNIATGDDAIAGYGNADVRVKGCRLSSACNIFRFGGRRVTIENCVAKGPCTFPWRLSLSGAEKASGHGDARGRGRRNTLSFYTHFGIAANMHEPFENAGEIVIRNVKVDNVDRLFHYDLAAGGRWQSIPLDDIRFESVTASDIGKALCARGTTGHPVTIQFKDCRIGFRTQQSELMNGEALKSLELDGVSVTGVKGPALRSYGDRLPLMRMENLTGVNGTVDRGNREFPVEHY